MDRITVELGGNCRTLTNDFHLVAEDLARSYLNVMRHYDMIDGGAEYARRWRMGHQQALLAPTSGMWVGNRDLAFEVTMPEDTLLGEIYDLYGHGYLCCLPKVCTPGASPCSASSS